MFPSATVRLAAMLFSANVFAVYGVVVEGRDECPVSDDWCVRRHVCLTDSIRIACQRDHRPHQ